MDENNRRKFIKNVLTVSAGAAVLPMLNPLSVFADGPDQHSSVPAAGGAFNFEQVALPYSYSALEPHIDAKTMEIHYTKHHTAYIKNVNDAIKAENLDFKNAYDFFTHASKLSLKARNNGGGAWNHNFFWQSLQPAAPAGPSGKLKEAIEKTFGSLEQFKVQFAKAGADRFGSGWAWLVNDNGTLRITSTANQDNPLMDDAAIKGTPLLALDVWEHAYYLKYQNKRADYITAFWNVVNWKAAEDRFKA